MTASASTMPQGLLPPRDPLDTISDALLIRMVNRLLRRAVEMRASDLQVEPQRTASVAAQAAHLVCASLHANASVAAIVRLRDLGLDDHLIAATVRAIIAQRLPHRLCPQKQHRASAELQRARGLRGR